MLIANLFETLKYTFEKYRCKECGYKSKSAIKLLYHLHTAHNIKINKSQWKFLVKYNLALRVLKSALALVALPLVVALKVVCLPFNFLYEIL
jgi:hypothetical protein